MVRLPPKISRFHRKSQFFMGIRRFEIRIIASHTHFTSTTGIDFPEVREPVVRAVDFRGKGGMSGDSSAEMPEQKR
jgi:hypothetical protein